MLSSISFRSTLALLALCVTSFSAQAEVIDFTDLGEVLTHRAVNPSFALTHKVLVVRTPDGQHPAAIESNSSDRITVVVDGIVMRLPRAVVEGQIEIGVFIVVSYDGKGLTDGQRDCIENFGLDCLPGI